MLLLAKIGTVLNIAKFTYAIIKDVSKLRNPAKNSLPQVKKQVHDKMNTMLEKEATKHLGKHDRIQKMLEERRQRD